MINRVSICITNKLLEKRIISDNDFELYHYGLFIILTETFLCAFCLLSGIALNIPVQSILFFFSFFILHRFAGGFHANKELHCLIITLSSFMLCMLGIKHFNSNLLKPIIIIFVISCFILIMFSPVDTPQKELVKKEKNRFRIIVTFIILFYVIFVILDMLLFRIFITISIVFAVILQAISIIFGRLLNHRLLS